MLHKEMDLRNVIGKTTSNQYVLLKVVESHYVFIFPTAFSPLSLSLDDFIITSRSSLMSEEIQQYQ